MRRLITIGAIVGAGVIAAGCTAGSGSSNAGGGGGGSTSSAHATTNSTLVIDNENGANWTCGFNPFNQAVNFLAVGFVYEPLVYVNPLQGGKTTPMLATSWTWGAGSTSLTFNIRSGVKWSDGQPLTAADVAFTFNMILSKKVPDINGLLAVVSSVTATSSTVTVNFKSPAAPYFYYVADQTPIVPQHQWASLGNPTNAPVSNPIGSGPFTVSKCSPQNITYTANANYWQPGEPKVHTLQYPAYLTNDVANADLRNGSAQWGSQFIPSIQSYYVNQSASNHYWFPPTVNLSLIPNLTDPQLSNVLVREALSYGINRTQVGNIGESGYYPASNQTGVVTPTFSSMLDQSAVSAWGNQYDPAHAEALLKQAGYHLGSNGIMVNAKGQQLSLSVVTNSGFSDWVADLQVMQQNFKAIGVQLNLHNLSANAFSANLYAGHYQLALYDQQIFGPSPYYELNNWLNSANTAPIGQQSGTNYERYSNKATDALLNQYAATTDPGQQQTLLNQIEQVMVTQVPVIPVVEAVDWYQYSTAKFSGWPTPQNPYAQPAVFAYPDNEQVLLRLTPNG
jgi:peptide/nickel transport system substrate-binding protein